MTRHVDTYSIDWWGHGPAEFLRRTEEGEDGFDCWEHGHSYTVTVQPHEDGECEAFRPTGEWKGYVLVDGRWVPVTPKRGSSVP